MNSYPTRDDALSAAAITDLVQHLASSPRLMSQCPMAVVRGGEDESCGKPVVALVAYEWDEAWWLDPMCARHVHRCHGTDNAVGLLDVITTARTLPGGH